MKILKLYLQYWLVKSFYIISFLLIFYGSYWYTTVQHFFIGNREFTNPFYHLHENLPFWINYLEYFIFVFTFSTILMIILTKIYSSNKKRKEKINEKFLKIYYKTVISDLFKENKDTELEETDNVYKYRHKRFAKSDLYKELIINTFIHVHYQTIGKIRLKTESMMNDLHYEKLIRSYLYSPFYKQKKLALNTISEFKITGYEKYLIKLAKQKKTNCYILKL